MKDQERHMKELKSFLRKQRKDLVSVLKTKVVKDKTKYDRTRYQKDKDHYD